MELPLIVGSEFRLTDGTVVVLLVATQAGYTALCRLLPPARPRARPGHSDHHRPALAHLAEAIGRTPWWDIV